MKNLLKYFLVSMLILQLLCTGTYLKKELDLESEKSDYTQINRPPDGSQIIVNPNILQQASPSKETQELKEEISKLRKDFTEQKNLTSTLLSRISELVDNQNQLINLSNENISIFRNISNSATLINQKLSFMDAVIFDKSGMPFGFIDEGSKVYEYNDGNLLGFINSNNEVVRNTDGSIIAIIDNDFLIDATGHPIASIERSENLRWEREKLYGKVQKTPASEFFIMNSPQPFNLSTFRFSTWSNQDLMSLLYFDAGEVQKLK